MDPELFNTRVTRRVVINDAANALAFVIGFAEEDLWTGQGQPSRELIPVAYVYRNVGPGGKIDYREMLLAELEKKHDVKTLAECLRAQKLAEIFR